MEAAVKVRDDFLSLEALLVSRAYLYTLFHKAFGGEPDEKLLELLATDITGDVLDEYAGESDTLRKLAVFARGLKRKISDARFLESVKDEFTRFFEGPAKLVAIPWESAYVGHKEMVFQASTLVVREAYAAQGLRTRFFGRMPDDHLSIMCVFMAHMALWTLKAFRASDWKRVSTLLDFQAAFVCDHMTNWLPRYAKDALRVREALLYPQLAQGIAAFVEIDGTFMGQALAWLDSSAAAMAGVVNSYDSTVFFGEAERTLEQLATLDLRGIDENELVEMSRPRV